MPLQIWNVYCSVERDNILTDTLPVPGGIVKRISQIRFVSLLPCLLLILACTRNVEQKSAVSLSLPTQISSKTQGVAPSKATSKSNSKASKSTLSTAIADVSHVVINASGPGIPTSLCHFDVRRQDATGPCDFSGFPLVTVNVPSGPDRLIQVGAMYEGSSAGAILTYGDAVRSLSPGNAEVSIALQTINAGAQQGRVYGRFLTSQDEGPTGRLDVRVRPPNGRPSITLMRTEIYSGWFQAMSLSSVDIEYVVVNPGQEFMLWGRPANKAFLESLQQSGGPVLVENFTEYRAFGFFGASSGLAGKSAAPTCGSLEFTQCIGGNSKFSGPFSAGANGLLSSTAGTFSWTYLPGVSTAITGVRILYNPVVNSQNNEPFTRAFALDDRQFNCHFLESLPTTQVLSSLVPNSVSSFVPNVGSFPATALFAICPVRDGRMMTSALVYPDNYNGGGSGPYLRLEVNNSGGGQVPTLTVGQCYPAQYKLFTSSGTGNASPYNVTTPATVTTPTNPLTGSPWFEVHTASGCNSISYAPMSISAGSSSAPSFWLKPILTGGGLGINPGLTSGESINFHASSNTFNVGLPELKIFGPSMLVTGSSPYSCYALSISRVEANGFMISSGPLLPIVLSDGGDVTLDYFLSPTDCQTSANLNPNLSIAAGTPSTQVFVRRTSGVGAIPLEASAGGFTSGTLNVTGSSASPFAAKFEIIPDGPGQFIGECNRVLVVHLNAAGVEVPFRGATQVFVGLSSPTRDVLFYAGGSCLGNSTDSVIFNPGDSRRVVFYRSLNTTSPSISVSTGSTAGTHAGITLTPSPDANLPYALFVPPKIRSTLLGSHEFPKLIPVAVNPAGATVVCHFSTDPTRSTWTSCTGSQFNAGSNTLTWLASDASQPNGTAYRFQVSSGLNMREVIFDPRRIYSIFHNGTVIRPFEVANCGAVLTPTGSNDFSAISAALSTSDVVCLNPGDFVGGTTATLNTNKKIIGMTNAVPGEPLSRLSLNGSDVLMINGTQTAVANIEFVPSTSGTNLSQVKVIASSGDFLSTNNFYKTNTYHKYGISKTTPSTVTSASDLFDVDGTGGFSAGFAANSCSACNGSPNQILRPSYALRSGSGVSYSRAVYLYQSSISVDIIGASLSGTFRNGSLLESDDSVGGNPKTINIRESIIRTFSAVSNTNRFPIFSNGKINLNIENSVIDTDLLTQPSIRLNSVVLGDILFVLKNSKVAMRRDANAISVPSTQHQNLVTENSDFIRAGLAGTASSAVSGGANHYWNSAGTQANGTRFCGESGSIQFSSTHSGFTPQGYSSWGSIPVNNLVDLTTLSCQ